MNLFSIYVGLSVLLITVLAMNISRLRMKEKIGTGDGGNKPLAKAIRAHMNSIEHILPYSLVMYVLVWQELPFIFLSIMGFGFLLTRVLNSFSMLGSRFRLRQITAGFTYLFEVVGCLTNLGAAVASQ